VEVGMNRVFGVETEFGCLVEPGAPYRYEEVVEAVKDHVFFEQRLGAIDLHARDEAFEPALSGGFLINGARLYVDAVGSHEEYATPECRTLRDLIASDRAGHRIVVRALKEVGFDDVASFYNNSVDHFGGQTFGCHENYLVRAEDRFLSDSVAYLYPFLVTRQIYAGVGRVGGHAIDYAGTRGGSGMFANPVDYIWVANVYGVHPDSSVDFQLSQRADHILKLIASRVRFNRALINPKWESFYSYESTTRLHLLFGESNQMEFAYALKVGTTCLMLDLIESGLVPDRLRMPDPLGALKSVSRDPTYRWIVELEGDVTISAVDLHREWLSLAQTFAGRDPDTDWTLENWAATLDSLEQDPMLLADRLDWVAKRKILEQFIEVEGSDWQDDALHSIDLEYHNIDPTRSLYHALSEMGEARRLVTELDVVDAMTEPPKNTRAFGRGKLVRAILASRRQSYWIDWDGVVMDRHQAFELLDPFQTYEDELPDVGK
jgi:proteasome accessory factor A